MTQIVYSVKTTDYSLNNDTKKYTVNEKLYKLNHH